MTFTEVPVMRVAVPIVGAATRFFALLLSLSTVPALAQRTDVPVAERQRALTKLLRQDCGACHGLRLTGGLGPPLTARALRDRPVDSMVATVMQGRSGTPMPPWDRFMTEAEARWLVAQLREGAFDAK